MNIAIIGRSEIMYETINLCLEQGFKIPIIITSKETPEYKRSISDFEIISKKIDAIFVCTSNLNTPEIINIMQSANIDIGLSINYSGLIAQSVIDTCRLGILNAHGGDLPRYRGNACQAWAILNGESKIGLSIYQMKGDYLDGGKIIDKIFLQIDINTTITECWGWFYDQIPFRFIEAAKILFNDPTFYIEDSTKSSIKPMRCYPRIPEDGRINWLLSNLQIIRLINASCEPYSGAFCMYEDQKLIIWKANIISDEEEYFAIPGQVCSINKESIDIITGDGKIRITEIEFNGKRCTPTAIIKSIRKRLQ